MNSQLGRLALSRLAAVTLSALTLVAAAPPTIDMSPTSSFVVSHVSSAIKRFTIKGTVDSVSYASNSVRINAAGQSVEILITPTTVIEFRGEAGSIADIRRGHKITASGVQREGTWIANIVTIR